MKCQRCGAAIKGISVERPHEWGKEARYCPYCGQRFNRGGNYHDADIRNLWSTPEERAEYDNPFNAQETAFIRKLIREELVRSMEKVAGR